MAYQADIRISVKGAKQLDALSKAADKLVPQINAANAAFIRLGEVQQKNLPLIANFSRVLRENQKAFASTILSNKEATTAARNQALAEKELNNELARRNAVLNKARGIKSDPIAKSIARNRAKFSDPNAPAFENIRDLPSGSKRPSRFAQFSQDVTKTSVEKKIQADLKNEKRLAKDIADIRSRSAKRVEASNKRRITSENKVKKIVEDSRKEQTRIQKIRSRDSVRRKRDLLDRPGVRIRRGLTGKSPAARASRQQGISNALIGGAFPLLFGQGPLAAAGGAIGGGLGGLMGGQFGFALSLVGTQIGSLISNLVTSAGELGKALGPFTQNIGAVTTALGLQGSVEEARLQLIEQAQGKTAAFNAAMKIMAARITQDGVDKLKNFGENTRLLGTQFTLALTRLQAFAAGVANFVIRLTGLRDALQEREATRIVAGAAATGDTRAQELVDRRRTAEGMRGQGGAGARKKALLDQLKIEEQIFAIQQRVSIEVAQLTTKSSTLLADKEKELALNKRVAEIMKTGVNKELAKSLAEVEQIFDADEKVLQSKLKQTQAEFDKLEKQGASDEVLNRVLEKEIAIEAKIDEHNVGKKESVKLTKQLFTETDKVAEAFEKLNQSIRNDIKEGIKGLIKGTSTLGDLLNNVADRFLDLALNQALFGSAAGEFKKGKGGGIFGAIAGIFKANGGPVRSGRSFIVGEKGPELFTPGRSGAITPNHKLMGGNNTSVVVNVDASGSDVQGDEAGAKELGGLISIAVQSELVKQQRPGGLLSSIR